MSAFFSGRTYFKESFRNNRRDWQRVSVHQRPKFLPKWGQRDRTQADETILSFLTKTEASVLDEHPTTPTDNNNAKKRKLIPSDKGTCCWSTTIDCNPESQKIDRQFVCIFLQYSPSRYLTNYTRPQTRFASFFSCRLNLKGDQHACTNEEQHTHWDVKLQKVSLHTRSEDFFGSIRSSFSTSQKATLVFQMEFIISILPRK